MILFPPGFRPGQDNVKITVTFTVKLTGTDPLVGAILHREVLHLQLWHLTMIFNSQVCRGLF